VFAYPFRRAVNDGCRGSAVLGDGLAHT
jgi:hypothetical protein